MRKTSLIIGLLIFALLIGPILQFFPLVLADDATEEIESSYYQIIIENPKNDTEYNEQQQIPINFTIDYSYSGNWVVWRELTTLYYSIDKEPAKILLQVSYGYTIPVPYKNSTDIDISSLENGKHTLEIIAKFSVDVGNVYITSYNRTSSPVYFSLNNRVNTSTPKPTPTPSIPEFPFLLVLPLLLSVIAIALTVKVKELRHVHLVEH